jgi:hypothetical protein
MRRRAIIVLAAVLLGAVVLVAAGCGSKKKASTTTTTAASTAATTSTTTGTTSSQNTTSTATTPASALGLFTSANCASLVNLAQAFSAALTGNAQDPAKTAKLFKEFADKTPTDIRTDFETFAAAYAKIAAALQGVDLTSGQAPSPEVIARLQKLSTEIDSAKVSQAGAHISAWAAKNCKSK